MGSIQKKIKLNEAKHLNHFKTIYEFGLNAAQKVSRKRRELLRHRTKCQGSCSEVKVLQWTEKESTLGLGFYTYYSPVRSDISFTGHCYRAGSGWLTMLTSRLCSTRLLP